jgi:hypothetical protein
VLRYAKTRPLDYLYLRELPPSAQRLYELISPKIFAAISNGNPRAKYLYSDLCRFAPLTRYENRQKVKKQLYKIHQPHKTSGYLETVELEEVVLGEGGARLDNLVHPRPARAGRVQAVQHQRGKGVR